MRGKLVRVKDRQTIWDIALQEYGSPDGVSVLLNDNPNALSGVNTVLIPGQKLYIISPAINQDVVNYYKQLNQYPASRRFTEEVDNGHYTFGDMGNWHGSIIPIGTGYLLNLADDSGGYVEIPNLVAGRSYIVSINFVEQRLPIAGGQIVKVELGNSEFGVPGSQPGAGFWAISSPGVYEKIMIADNGGQYLWVKGGNEITAVFNNVSVIEIL
jgi:hypothetical protein